MALMTSEAKTEARFGLSGLDYSQVGIDFGANGAVLIFEPAALRP